MAEQTKSPQSGQERTKRPETPQGDRWQREMLFVPFEGMVSLSSQKEQLRRSLAQAVQTRLSGPNAEAALLDSMAGTSAVKSPIEKHAGLMSDPRFLHSANIERSARLVNRMHETYGNTHVQRVVDLVQTKRLPEAPGTTVVQRGGLLETVGRWLGGEPEPQTITATEPEEERELPGPHIESVPAEAPAAEREEAEQPTGRTAAEGEPTAQLRERGYLVNPESPVAPVTWTRWSDRPRTRQLRAAAPAAETEAQTELEGQTAEQTGLRTELTQAEAELTRLDARLRETPREERGSITTETPEGPVPLGQRVRELRERTIPRLRRQITSLTYEINATRQELAQAQGLQQETPPASLGNPNAIEVNLNHSGVNVRQKNGRQQDTSEWRLEPAFALAVANYLEEIRELGVTDLYNQGFLREPESPDDTHPQGLAVDICGFMIHGHRLELSHDDAESAWFNTTDRIPELGQTYREVIVNLATRLASHFGQILGPGFNAMHMNHFHVQLRAARRGDETLRAPGTPENPRPFERRR